MSRRVTLKIFAAMAAAYGAAVAPALLIDGYADSPIGVLLDIPFLSIYLFHALGIPGLLQHGGACGWGFCAPTWFGWVVLVVFWLLLAWLVATILAALVTGKRRRQ